MSSTDPQAPVAGLMTREQVAELLVVSVQTVDRATKLGQLKAVRIGRAVRYDLRDVLAFVEDRRG